MGSEYAFVKIEKSLTIDGPTAVQARIDQKPQGLLGVGIIGSRAFAPEDPAVERREQWQDRPLGATCQRGRDTDIFAEAAEKRRIRRTMTARRRKAEGRVERLERGAMITALDEYGASFRCFFGGGVGHGWGSVGDRACGV